MNARNHLHLYGDCNNIRLVVPFISYYKILILFPITKCSTQLCHLSYIYLYVLCMKHHTGYLCYKCCLAYKVIIEPFTITVRHVVE